MVFFSIWIHECAHAIAAKVQGDDTAVRNGYLWPNPMKIMGISAIISLFIIGITWGSVPVNYMRLKKGRIPPLIVASSGPFANLALYIVFCFVGTLIFKHTGSNIENHLFQMMFIGAVLNIVLFVFNIIPVQPLDGWIIAICIFPVIAMVNRELRNGLMFGLFVLVFLSFGHFFTYGQYAVLFTMKFFESLLVPTSAVH